MYYSVYHWIEAYDQKFQDQLKKLFPDLFVPGKDECFLKVPDDQAAVVFQTLTTKYDVMIMDRHGKPYMYLDYQGKHFTQR